MTQKELKLTPASSWGDNTELVELPSGKVAKLRRLNVLMMLERGGDDVPNFLKVYMLRKIKGQKVSNNPMDGVEDAREAVRMIAFLAKQVFAYPRLVDVVQADDEVCIDAISEVDLSFAAAYALGDRSVVNQLESFRAEAQSDVEPVYAGEDVGTEA